MMALRLLGLAALVAIAHGASVSAAQETGAAPTPSKNARRRAQFGDDMSGDDMSNDDFMQDDYYAAEEHWHEDHPTYGDDYATEEHWNDDGPEEHEDHDWDHHDDGTEEHEYDDWDHHDEGTEEHEYDAEEEEEPSCMPAGEPMSPWLMAEMEYISERCYHHFAICFGDGNTFDFMSETNPWRQGYCDFRPTECWEAVNMCEEVDPMDCEGLTQGACMPFTNTGGEAGCMPSPQGNDLAYAAFNCYNEVWPQWNATYDGPRNPDPGHHDDGEDYGYEPGTEPEAEPESDPNAPPPPPEAEPDAEMTCQFLEVMGVSISMNYVDGMQVQRCAAIIGENPVQVKALCGDSTAPCRFSEMIHCLYHQEPTSYGECGEFLHECQQVADTMHDLYCGEDEQ